MASPRYFIDFDWDWLPCVRTYSLVHSVSCMVLFTLPSLKSADIRCSVSLALPSSIDFHIWLVSFVRFCGTNGLLGFGCSRAILLTCAQLACCTPGAQSWSFCPHLVLLDRLCSIPPDIIARSRASSIPCAPGSTCAYCSWLLHSRVDFRRRET